MNVDEAIVDHYAKGKSAHEIAKTLGLPLNHIHQALVNAMVGMGRTADEFGDNSLPTGPFTRAKVEAKDTNPKSAIGGTKIPLHLWPNIASTVGALAFLDGAGKYGRQNYRPMGAKASTYYDAAKRHLDAWWEGEDKAPDSLVHHLGHSLACIAIILETHFNGNLEDDRAYPGGYFKMMDELEGEVTRIKQKYEDRTVVHYDLRVFKKAAEASREQQKMEAQSPTEVRV